jgi:hypothetical protein
MSCMCPAVSVSFVAAKDLLDRVSVSSPGNTTVAGCPRDQGPSLRLEMVVCIRHGLLKPADGVERTKSPEL